MRDIFASRAEDYWAAGKLELRYTYLLHGVSLALEKAIVPGYVAKSVEISDLAPYDDEEEIARALRPRRGAFLSATDAGARHDFRTHQGNGAKRRHRDRAELDGFWLQNRLRPPRKALDHGNIAANLCEAAGTRGVPDYLFLVLPQDGTFNFLMARNESKVMTIPQHLMMNVLAKRAGKS